MMPWHCIVVLVRAREDCELKTWGITCSSFRRKRICPNAARLYLNERLILYRTTLHTSFWVSAGCILWCAFDIYRIQRATTGPRNFNAARENVFSRAGEWTQEYCNALEREVCSFFC